MSNEIKNEKWKELFEKQQSQSLNDKENESLIDSYYFIYNCQNNEINYINSAFETITGYDSKQFNIEHLINCIHPDDQEYFFKCEENDLDFKNNLKYNDHFHYLYSYTYKLKIKNGEYITIKQTCQALDVNKKGDLITTLVIHQRIDNYDFRPINDHKIYDKTRNIYLQNDNCYKLTKRELEILRLVQDGLNSNEIANKLCTSKFTIDTHRKNILNKTNSANFIELIKKLSYG